jgi:hypothetical protein
MKADPKVVYEIAVKIQLPKLVEAIEAAKKDNSILILHQDAFAADYQEHELYLLGAAIKWAGEQGVEVHIIGKNRETL